MPKKKSKKMNYQENCLWKKKDCFTHPILDVSEACD